MRRILTLVSLIACLGALAAPAFAQTPPAALQAQTAGTGQITLTWTAVAGATQYYVYLGTQSGGPYTTRSYSVSSTTTHLSIGSLSDTITYYAIVKTVVSGTPGPASAQVSVCSGSAQLAAPANLAGTATSGQVALTWSSVPGATAYDVYRSPDAADNQDGLLVSGLTATSYTDTSVTNGTSYTYQVAAVVSTGEGTQCGPVAETPLSPPALSAEATANQQHTEIDLSWTASAGATSYTLNRRTSGSQAYYATITSGTAYADTAVTANTTYYYTIVAVAGTSSSSPSGEVSAKAGSALLSAPTLTASSANAQASLSWTTVSGAAYYDVYRATGANTPVFYAHLSNVTAYTDNNLNNGTTYVYQVAAGSVNGQGMLSNTVSVTPLAAPTISAATISSSEIDLSWTASLGATAYHLDRSASSGNGPWTLIASPTGTTEQDTGLTAGTNYWYHLQAVSSTGSSNSSNSVLAETASGAPANLTATPGSAQVSLSWTAPAGDVGSYKVYRGTSTHRESGTPVAVGITGTTYTDNGLPNGPTYYYQVTAVDEGGEGTKSNEASATPPSPSLTAPTGLSATGFAGEIDLLWVASPGATGYQVERSADGGSNWTTITTAAITTASYRDMGLPPLMTDYYRVVAINSNGSSAPSAAAYATTLTSPPTSLTAAAFYGQVTLNWTAPTSGAAFYTIKRSTTSGQETSLISGIIATTWVDASCANGTTYDYEVSGTYLGQEGPNSNEASATPGGIPAPPTNVTATLQANGTVLLQWTPSVGASSYNVYGVPSGTVTGITATSYAVAGLASGISYRFTVTAVNSSGESAPSGTAVFGNLNGPFRVTGVSFGTVSLAWNTVNGVPGSAGPQGQTNPSYFTLGRSPGSVFTLNPNTLTSYTDTSIVPGTTYAYTLTAYVYTFQYPNGTQNPGQFVLTTTYPQTLTVTLQQSPVTDDQAVDGRIDSRYSIPTYLNYQFKNNNYLGGLFTGYANDPSTIGRSYLRFPAPSSISSPDHLWSGKVELYCTGAVAPPPVTYNIVCQFVPDNGWTAANLSWGSAPFVNLGSSASGASVTYNPPTVSPWAQFDVTSVLQSQLSGSHPSAPLCFAVTNAYETSGGPNWMYFARKEYNASEEPYLLYAYGH